MADSISSRYAALVAAGEIERDPAQEAAVAKLARLNERLAQHRLARKSSSLGWLFGKKGERAPAGESETRELFTVSRTVNGPVERAFAVFADRIGEWWPRDYTWAKEIARSGQARALEDA